MIALNGAESVQEEEVEDEPTLEVCGAPLPGGMQQRVKGLGEEKGEGKTENARESEGRGKGRKSVPFALSISVNSQSLFRTHMSLPKASAKEGNFFRD